MKLILAALLMALGAGGAALAQSQPVAQLPAGAIVISPGERVEVTIGPGDQPIVAARAPMPAGDAAAIPTMDNSYERVGAITLQGRPTPDRLVFELVSDPKNGARLKLLNGYGDPVIYSADLVLAQGARRAYVPTSICPVRAGIGGLETWANDVAGIAITGVRRVDAAHMGCNNGSLLSVEAAGAGDRYVCVGGEKGAGPLPPFSVALIVSPNGAVSEQIASWSLSQPDIMHAPMISFDFAMEGNRLTPGAHRARVAALVGLQPPPAAKAADIVLLLDGAEVARRPWRMYAQNRAALASAEKKPVAFSGVIPFVPESAPADDGLRRLLARAGERGGTLVVRIVGDDGTVIEEASYELGSSPIRDPAVVGAALAAVQTMAKTPAASCHKISP